MPGHHWGITTRAIIGDRCGLRAHTTPPEACCGTAHCTPAELRKSSVRIVGKAAMIAVPLAPTASIARHDDHRTDVNPVRCFNLPAVLHFLRAISSHRVPARRRSWFLVPGDRL